MMYILEKRAKVISNLPVELRARGLPPLNSNETGELNMADIQVTYLCNCGGKNGHKN